MRRLPRRAGTTLNAESLINDATALTLYGVAVSAATTGAGVSAAGIVGRLLLSSVIAIAVGLATGCVALWVRRFLPDSLAQNTVSLLTPFVAFLPAQAAHASGVLAVVICGLVVAYGGPSLIPAATRRQAFGFWQITSYVLNGSLFILTGLQFRSILRGIEGESPAHVAALCGVAIGGVVGTRLIWFNTTPYVIRAIDRRATQRALRVPARQRLPLAWAGLRGAVSLAAALAVPETVPYRADMVAVTFAVITFTLTVQGTTFPLVLRWAGIPKDTRMMDEERLAMRTALESALEALPEVARNLGAPDTARDHVLAEYARELTRYPEPTTEAPGKGTPDWRAALKYAIIPVKRGALLQLRDSRRIDDTVLRRVQERLDVEEIRLAEQTNRH